MSVIQFPSSKFLTFSISDEERSEYEFTLKERAGAYMDEGYAEKEADQFALDDTGCLEYWHYVNYKLPERQSQFVEGPGLPC